MSKTLVIARKDVEEAFRSRSTYLYLVVMALVSLPYFDGLRNITTALVKQGASPVELEMASQSFLNTAVSTLPLGLAMIVCSVFSAYAVVLDKAKRRLESLMATPLSLRQIWLGKSLAVALPGVVLSLAVLAVAVCALNVWVILPIVGAFVMPGTPSLATALIVVPVLVFLVVSLVSLVQLVTTNPRMASLIFTALFFGIYFSTITEVTRGWDFGVIYMATAAVLLAITLWAMRFLTKERVILTSKG